MQIQKDYSVMIHHCLTESYYSKGGGVQTYVNSLVNHRPADVSERILHSITNIDQSQFKLLHLHDRDLLCELRDECAAIYTLHNHDTYCPSGTKHFETSGTCCNRQMSLTACMWGQLIGGCGSRRPQNAISNIKRAMYERDMLLKTNVPIIANSDYVRLQLIKNGVHPQQVTTLHCGIGAPSVAVEPLTSKIHQNQRLLFVGRIVPRKGLGWLIKALAKTSSSIQLDIAGDGWGRLSVEKLINQLGLNHRVIWHGWCSSEKLEQLYQECFAVVFPSLWPEPAGLVTLEANARYRPIIASLSGGIPEYVCANQTGLLVSRNHTDELAEAIIELAQNYQKARQLGEHGYEWYLKKFTVETHIQQLQMIYEKVIKKFEYEH